MRRRHLSRMSRCQPSALVDIPAHHRIPLWSFSGTPPGCHAHCTDRVEDFRRRLACRFVFASFVDKYKQPSKLSPAIAATNMHLRRFAESNDRVTYVDCSDVLLEKVSV